jgi:hypothetical protein
MKEEHQALWEKIQDLELDNPEAAFPFSKKLAHEANWSMPFTRLAIAEYKKFLLLCCISPRGASPSEVVDKVWHLHLTYTRNYWDELCNKVLGQPLHHHPSAGGIEEQKKHQAWYEETLVLYTEVFNENPPPAIWPTPVDRELAAVALEFKKCTRITPNVWQEAGGIVVLFLFITYNLFGVLNPYLLKGPVFLEFMFLLFLLSIGIAILLLSCQKQGFQKVIHTFFPEINIHYGMIELVYGKSRALQTAIVELVNHQLLEVKPTKKFINQVTKDVLLPAGNPLLPALTQRSGTNVTLSEKDELRYEDLKKLYYSYSSDTPDLWRLKWLALQKFSWRWVPYLFVMLLLFIRLVQGMNHHQPVGFLLLGTLLFTIVYAFIVYYYNPAEILKQVVHKKMMESLASLTNAAPADQLTAEFSNRGRDALAGLESYVILTGIFALASNPSKAMDGDSGDGGSAGGCGGSSCGGGCGGCGGCGGS